MISNLEEKLDGRAAQISEIVSGATILISAEDVVVARKNHLSFYTNAQRSLIPNKQTLVELRNEICYQHEKKSLNIWLYYDSNEKIARPQFYHLLQSDHPNWLKLVLRDSSTEWILFRVACNVTRDADSD